MSDDDAFGHWFAGFLDGEGCFAISGGHGRHRGLRCVVRMALRIDDEPIVREIQERLNLGSVITGPVKGGCPQVVWTITSKSDCLALVSYLDRYPLRAKKARDYGIWREAVLMWQHAGRGRRGPTAFDWSGMQQLREALMSGRAYGGDDWIPTPPEQLGLMGVAA